LEGFDYISGEVEFLVSDCAVVNGDLGHELLQQSLAQVAEVDASYITVEVQCEVPGRRLQVSLWILWHRHSSREVSRTLSGGHGEVGESTKFFAANFGFSFGWNRFGGFGPKRRGDIWTSSNYIQHIKYNVMPWIAYLHGQR